MSDSDSGQRLVSDFIDGKASSIGVGLRMEWHLTTSSHSHERTNVFKCYVEAKANEALRQGKTEFYRLSSDHDRWPSWWESDAEIEIRAEINDKLRDGYLVRERPPLSAGCVPTPKGWIIDRTYPVDRGGRPWLVADFIDEYDRYIKDENLGDLAVRDKWELAALPLVASYTVVHKVDCRDLHL